MIRIDKLCFGYRRNKLLYRDLDLSVDKGRIYGLLGKNGAGKSTLLKNMMGLLFPSAGSISVNGFRPSERKPSFLRTIFFIPEEVYIPPLTIDKYVTHFAPFYPNFNRDELNAYLAKLEINTVDKITKFSFGQQKKFLIAFALACNTEILIMDEPTNGLDIPSKKQFRKLISGAMNEHRMIFISTHQTRDLENLIDQVIIVDNGELLLNEPVESVSTKLAVRLRSDIDSQSSVLYEEETPLGQTVIIENINGLAGKISLEHLFNAATTSPQALKQIFHNSLS